MQYFAQYLIFIEKWDLESKLVPKSCVVQKLKTSALNSLKLKLSFCKKERALKL